jgi:hypothetical protein
MRIRGVRPSSFSNFWHASKRYRASKTQLISRGIPMNGWAGWNFVTSDNPNPPAGEVPDANYVVIGPPYFRTMQIPLREGRPFSDADTPSSEPVVIVSEPLAKKYWPSQNPIGKRLQVSASANDTKLPWLCARADVANLVVRHGTVLTPTGIATGMIGAFAIIRFLASLPFQVRWTLRFDVRPADPLLLGVVSEILAMIASVDSYIPPPAARPRSTPWWRRGTNK